MDQVAIWHFPSSEFDAWKSFVGSEVRSHADYLSLVRAAADTAERNGMTPVLVDLPVSEMQSKLAFAAMDNTPENRAEVLARQIAGSDYILGIKVGHEKNQHPKQTPNGFIGWCIVRSKPLETGVSSSIEDAFSELSTARIRRWNDGR